MKLLRQKHFLKLIYGGKNTKWSVLVGKLVCFRAQRKFFWLISINFQISSPGRCVVVEVKLELFNARSRNKATRRISSEKSTARYLLETELFSLLFFALFSLTLRNHKILLICLRISKSTRHSMHTESGAKGACLFRFMKIARHKLEGKGSSRSVVKSFFRCEHDFGLYMTFLRRARTAKFYKLFTIKVWVSSRGNKSKWNRQASFHTIAHCSAPEYLDIWSGTISVALSWRKKPLAATKSGNIARPDRRAEMRIRKLDFLIFHASNESDCEGS